MKKMERILIATDFGPSAQAATEVGISLAKRFDSALTFINVVAPVRYSSTSMDALKRNAEEQFKLLQERLVKEEVNVDEFIIAPGKPVDEILKTAEHHNFNVIVQGVCGEQSTIARLVLGNTAEKIIRKSEKPVLTVKPPETDIFEHILAPVDFSDASARALRNAIRLARAFESQLTVLHVVEGVKQSLRSKVQEKDAQTQWEKEASTEFDNFLLQADLYELVHQKILRAGEPYQEIQKEATEAHADLIVMGSSGRSGLVRETFMGTTASKVSRALPCSLLTVKEEDILRVALELDDDIEDIEALYNEGLELLEAGLLEEAVARFEHLLRHDMHFAPGWDVIARAYERLNRQEEAETCRERAKKIRERLWAQRVDAEIRRRHLV
ncbi:MAG: universal stress protein [Candidatus Poribacteria bacterium]